MSAIENGFTSVMMDGSLKEDGKTPADYDYNVEVTAEVVKQAHAKGVSVEGELGCLGSLESGEGEQEDGHGAVGTLITEQLLTDPEEAERFRCGDRCRCLGGCDWHQSWGLQIYSQARWGSVGDGSHRRNPQTASQLPLGDARKQQRSSGAAGHHQSVRR